MSDAEGAVHTLMEQECILVKIFNHLLEYGLQECRLVCKKWKEVASRRMPLKLSPLLTDLSSLSTMERFPNVSSLVLNRALKGRTPHSNEGWMLPSSRQPFCLSPDIVEFLASFKNLKHLDVSQVPAAIPENLVAECYRSLKNLHSLNLGQDCIGHCIGADYIAAVSLLSSLGNLTALTMIDSGLHEREGAIPVPGLSNIQRLTVSSHLLVWNDGVLLFPFLKNLRHLILSAAPFTVPWASPEQILGAITCYASGLRTLSLPPMPSANVNQNVIDILAQFARLESLSFYVTDGDNVDFFLLGEMPHLRELKVYALCVTEAMVNWFSSLQKLRCLSYSRLVNKDFSCKHFLDYVSQLTKLSFCGPMTGALFEPRDLIELSVRDDYSGPGACDPELLLLNQTRLEKLEIICDRLPVPSTVLSRLSLSKLKSLTLANVYVDRDIFSTLSSLKELTELYFGALDTSTLRSDISLMTQLRSLTLRCHMTPVRFSHTLLRCLRSGWLPRLHYFTLFDAVLSDEEQDILRERMPNLRRLLITPWGNSDY